MSETWNLLHVLDAILSPDSGLDANERLVVLALARYQGKDGAYPSCETLAADTNLGERTVRRVLERVRDRGDAAVAVTWIQPSRRSSRRYQITLQRRRSRPVTATALDTRDRSQSPDSDRSQRPLSTPETGHGDRTETGHSDRTQNPRPVTVTARPVTATALRPVMVTGDPPIRSTQGSTQGGCGGNTPRSNPPPKPKPPTRRGTRIPDDWRPGEELIVWAATAEDVQLGRQDVLSFGAEFVDFWAGRSKDATKLDWDRTFKNRLRDVRRRWPNLPRARPEPKGPPPTLKPSAEVLERAEDVKRRMASGEQIDLAAALAAIGTT